MCGRFTRMAPWPEVYEYLNLIPGEPVAPRYNIAPTQKVFTFRLVDGKPAPAEMRWGLIPSWSKDGKGGYSTINARSEDVATSKLYGRAFKSRRCLVVADGYYEWLSATKTDKRPYLHQIDGGKPFCFAGLWERWQDIDTCTILTTAANDLASQYHDRMPVILEPSCYLDWLQCKHIPLVSFATERMTARPVSKYVNKVGNEGPGCVTDPS